MGQPWYTHGSHGPYMVNHGSCMGIMGDMGQIMVICVNYGHIRSDMGHLWVTHGLNGSTVGHIWVI